MLKGTKAEIISEQILVCLYVGLYMRGTGHAHHSTLLALPHYTDLNISGFKCLKQGKLMLTDTWQMANGRLWLVNERFSFGESIGKFFNITI